jgi:NitT/TauT family transport system substrate-binding protein
MWPHKFVTVMTLLLVSITASAAEPIKIAYTVWVGFGPLFLAQEKGFFAKHGVQVELVKIDDTKLKFAALAARRIDGAGTAVETVPLYAKPDFRIKTVLPLDYSFGADGIVAARDIKSVAELRGRTIAFEHGSAAEFYVTYVLREAGLKIADVRAVNMKTTDAGAAMLAGRVDAAMTWEPWLSKAKEAAHAHLLQDSSQVPKLFASALVFREDVIRTRRVEVQGIVKGWLEAVEYFKSHREESLPIMAKKVGGWLEDPKAYAETLSKVGFYDRAALNGYFLGADADIFKKTALAIELWAAQGKISKALKPEDLIDNTLVPQ